MAKKDSETTEAERGAVEVADGPLLDLTDAAVKRMIKLAKKRGFVTYAELNAVLPSEEVNSEQIEDILSMLNEMGINVIENEEQDEAAAEEAGEEEEESQGGDLVEAVQSKAVDDAFVRARRSHRRSRQDVFARNGFGRTLVARGRNRHRQAHRGWPRGDDRRALREPADVSGDHHLA